MGQQMGYMFNAKMCYIMSINCKSTHYYTLCDHILKQVEENPYLGLTLTESLKWYSHITKITKKATTTLNFLQRNLKNSPTECRKTVYVSLVRSILDYGQIVWDPFLDYGQIVWDPYLKQDVERLERVQRQAARFITRGYRTCEEGCVTRMLQFIRAVLVGKSSFYKQTHLHVQGGPGVSAGYTSK